MARGLCLSPAKGNLEMHISSARVHSTSSPRRLDGSSPILFLFFRRSPFGLFFLFCQSADVRQRLFAPRLFCISHPSTPVRVASFSRAPGLLRGRWTNATKCALAPPPPKHRILFIKAEEEICFPRPPLLFPKGVHKHLALIFYTGAFHLGLSELICPVFARLFVCT